MIKFEKIDRNGRAVAGSSVPAVILDSVTSQLNQAGIASLANNRLGGAVLSIESADSNALSELNQATGRLNTVIASVVDAVAATHKSSNESLSFTVAQRDAAVYAGLVGSDVHAFMQQAGSAPVPSMEGLAVVPASGGDIVGSRMKLALESYDEKNNKSTVQFSISYNLQAARQDEFGETFFPTVIVPPDQPGYFVSIELIEVWPGVKRSITGEPDNFATRKNIAKALIDPSILKNDMLALTPVVRPGTNDAMFVPATLVPPVSVMVEEESVLTAPLAVSKRIGLIGLSQTEALLETGVLNETDTLDVAMGLKALIAKVGTKAIRFDTSALAISRFTYSPQGGNNLMVLNADYKTLLVDANTKDIAGAAIADLAAIGTENVTVRLGVQIGGRIDRETGEATLNPSAIEVMSVVLNTTNQKLDLDSGVGATIKALFDDVTIVGWEVDARRSNANLRERGQLVNTRYFAQYYDVPLRSPSSIPRPLAAGYNNDGSDLRKLVVLTYMRTSIAAVDTLLTTADQLKGHVSSNDAGQVTPEIFGVTREIITPVFYDESVDATADLSSITAAERAADLRALLVNKIRDLALKMYVASGYKAAAAVLGYGDMKPVVLIGTDPYIANWLMQDGDLRTLGETFETKIVSTINERMAGKIAVTFGVATAGDGTPNPLHFGNMAWRPELVLELPLHRQGSNSKQLTVQPAFRHYVNMPVLTMIEVSGISDVVAKKVSIDFNEV